MSNNQFKTDVDGLLRHAKDAQINQPFLERIKKGDSKLGDLAEKFNDAGKQIQKYVDERKK